MSNVNSPPAETIAFTVPRPYTDVFRDVRAYGRECLRRGLVTAQMDIDADIDPKTKTAMVDSYISGGLGNQHYVRVDISSTGPNASNVAIKFWYNGLFNQNEIAHLRAAASGAGITGCGLN